MDTNFSQPASALTGRSRGVANPAANGVLTSFNIPHGLGAAPAYVCVTPGNLLSAALMYVTADATNITVTFAAAPLVGDLSLRWVAEI